MKTDLSPHTLQSKEERTVVNSKPIHYIMWRIGKGGAEMSVHHYINRFSKERPLYAYSLKKMNYNIYEGKNIQTREGTNNKWLCNYAYFKYCRKNRNHIFHLLNGGPLILLITLLAGVKNPVYHIHGTKYWKNWSDIILFKPVWWLISFFKVKYIANSAYSASIFHREVLKVNPQVIYNGFDVQRFLNKRSLRTAPRRIGYAGRLHTGKNVDLVIRLFEEVAADYPDMELLLAGDGDLRPALEAQARQSPYQDRIKFLGFVEDIPSFYSSIDLFVFLSAYESFGNVLAEALLTGLPVLTSDISVFSEIHGGEPDFLLGDPKHFDTIKQNFRQAITHYPALAQKAWATSEHIREKFDITSHLLQMENIYEKY